MRSLIVSTLLILSNVLPVVSIAVAQESEMQPPEPLTINFETQGCGRFKQEAYYRTEYHFVNICRGEASLIMVVTDNDGLGRERVPVEKQTLSNELHYSGTSDRDIGYAINNTTFTISFPGQKPYAEKVTKASFTGLATANAAAIAPTKPIEAATVRGNITYRQRIALPSNAVVKVRLEDVSRVDAKATLLDEQTIQTNGKQVPIPFALKYDPNQIKPNHTYAVSARILIDNKLRWVSTTRNAVITMGKPIDNVTVVVSPATR